MDNAATVCACGASYSSPHGEEDAVKFVQWHVDEIHGDSYPDGIDIEGAREFIVTVAMDEKTGEIVGTTVEKNL